METDAIIMPVIGLPIAFSTSVIILMIYDFQVLLMLNPMFS